MPLPRPYYQDAWVTIYLGDCRDILPELPKVDLVLTDPPYGVTCNDWDIAPQLDVFWDALSHLSHSTTAYVLTAIQPFSSQLVMSNLRNFKYEYIWDKGRPTGFYNANKQVLRQHESVLVFYQNQCLYNPQKTKLAKPYKHVNKIILTSNYGDNAKDYNPHKYQTYGEAYPTSILYFPKDDGGRDSLHPTQKPEALFQFLINTYTNADDLILDPFLGSGTTAYCAKKLNRHCIGIEIEEKYCEIAARRCMQSVMPLEVAPTLKGIQQSLIGGDE